MNVILSIYYCYCSSEHYEIDTNTNNCSKDYIIDKNSFSAAYDQPLKLSIRNVQNRDLLHINNLQNLVGSIILNETNNEFADSIFNTRDNIEVHFKNNSDQYKNITHDQQNLNFIDDEDLKDKDIKTGLNDQQNYIKKISTVSKIPEIFFLEKSSSFENNQFKRKYQKAGFSISKNDQKFLERDIKKQKYLTDEPVIGKNTYNKNDDLSPHNTASTSADYFNKLQIDGIKSLKSDLKTGFPSSLKNNTYTCDPSTKELENTLSLRDIPIKKRYKYKNASFNIKNSHHLDKHENADTIDIFVEFYDLFNKINLMGSTSCDHAYRVFKECLNIIQQDLIKTLRSAYEVIYEENEFINEQIKKLENSKENINMILRLKDTIHICQELLTFEIKKFTQKANYVEHKDKIKTILMKYLGARSLRKMGAQISIENRINYLQNLLKEHKECNKISCFMEIINIIKKTTNKSFKYMFLAGMNFLLDKNIPGSEAKNIKINVLFYLHEHENERFEIDWEEFLFKMLFFRRIFPEFDKDAWVLIKRYDTEIAYQGYIYMNHSPHYVTNFLLGTSYENVTFNEATKSLIELVNRIKCRLFDIPY